MNPPETATDATRRLEMGIAGRQSCSGSSPAWSRFTVRRPDGTRILVRLAGLGDLVGPVDHIDTRGRHAQVSEAEALTKSSVALFTREYVIKLLQSLDHAALLQMIERLNTAWSSMAQWFGTFLGMSFRERLEAVLRELGAKFVTG